LNIKNKTKIIPIADIKPYPNNAKIHPPEQIEQIKQSLEQYDYIQPICVDKNNVIVIGHGRYDALKDKGGDLEVVDLSYLSDDQVKKLRILDNKLVSGEWDKKTLQQEIENIYGGFDDMDKIMDELAISEKELNDLAPVLETEGDDDIPEDVKPVTKLGDLWELGRHRVLCGDSTKEDDVNRLMDGKKADMLYCDPPYGMFLDTDYSTIKNELKFAQAKGVKNGTKYKKVKGDYDDFTPQLIQAVFDNFGYCKEIFLWGADYYAEYLKDRNQGSWVVWDKRSDIGTAEDIVKSRDRIIGSGFELCWSKKRHKRMLARILWAGIFGTEQEKKIEKGYSRTHPTQKPIRLAIWFFDYYSIADKKNIVDLYLGSGSTLIACEKTNRICYGMELDEHYCDVIVQRYIDFCTKNSINIEVKHNGENYKRGISDGQT